MHPVWRKNYLRYKSYFMDVVGRYKERADIKAYLEILLSLASISVFSIFALRPTLLTIAELTKDIGSKRKVLATMNEKIQNLNAAQTLFDRQSDKIRYLDTTIPNISKADEFARQAEGLSSKHQVSILDISTGRGIILGQTTQAENQADLSPFPEGANALAFSLRVSASIDQYPSLTNFVSDFERLRRPAKVDLLKIISNIEKEEKRLILLIDGRFPYLYSSN